MKRARQLLLLCLLSLESMLSLAKNLQSIEIDLHDKKSLQRGAQFFMNYCSGCHSLKYMRYNSMARALGLTTFDGQIDEELLKSNLILTQATVYDPITIALPKEDALQWFGILPPDLSLTAREKGPAWIFNYLKSFYMDDSRPFKTNNLLVPDVGMPNVLEPLIGKMVLVQDKGSDASHLVLAEQGEMFEAQLNSALQDLVTFLAYVGEPAQIIRYRLGYFVIFFLFIFLWVTYQLKNLYWKNLTE